MCIENFYCALRTGQCNISCMAEGWLGSAQGTNLMWGWRGSWGCAVMQGALCGADGVCCWLSRGGWGVQGPELVQVLWDGRCNLWGADR